MLATKRRGSVDTHCIYFNAEKKRLDPEDKNEVVM
jgi:hypothetical protein